MATLLLLLLALTMTPPSTAFTTSPSTCTWTPHGSPYPLHALSSGICPLESSPTGTPWSHPPLCPPPANPSVGGDLPDPCLYAYTTFRGNSGLSLITSPEIAASLAPALDDTAVPAPFRSHITSPQQPLPADDASRGFTVLPLPRRGLGVLATRPLAKGELVMVAAPVLLVRADFLTTTTTGGASEAGGRFSVRQQEAVLEGAVRQLPLETQKKVVGLARRGELEGYGSLGGLVRDVVGTNAFHLEVEGVDHLVVYLEPSRMNHGCRPK